MTTTTAPRTNRYAATCAACDARVPANGGVLAKAGRAWTVRHLACVDAKASDAPRVVEFYSPSSGWRGTRNVRGRCEDAPCCGCCTC